MKAKDVMVVYGIGECGKAYVDRCVSCGLAKDNIKIVDSNENLWGGEVSGY